MIVRFRNIGGSYWEKEYLCPRCNQLIRKEQGKGDLTCYTTWSLLETTDSPNYCPICGTSLKGSCLFEPVHGRYPDCDRLGWECHKCSYWMPKEYENDSK